MYERTTDTLTGLGWEVRVADRMPTINCLIVDRTEALLADLPAGDREPQTNTHLVHDSRLVATIQGHFDML